MLQLQAKIWNQANFEAKSEARPTLMPDQANGAKPGQVLDYAIANGSNMSKKELC